MDERSRVVKVEVRHERLRDHCWPEIRVATGLTVAELKDKLYIKTGTRPSVMALSAYLPGQESATRLDEEDEPLYNYGIDDGCVIVVRETSGDGAKFSPYLSTGTNYATNITHSARQAGITRSNASIRDSSLEHTKLHEHYQRQAEEPEDNFQRYQMSEEDYAARNTGVREFIHRMRRSSAKMNEDFTRMNEEPTRMDGVDSIRMSEEPGRMEGMGAREVRGRDVTTGASRGSSRESIETTLERLRKAYPIGARCSVSPGDRRGEVKFVGLLSGTRVRIGVALDEPLGNSNGTFNAVKYFETHGNNYGGFYDPQNVAVGDFPQFDISDFLNPIN